MRGYLWRDWCWWRFCFLSTSDWYNGKCQAPTQLYLSARDTDLRRAGSHWLMQKPSLIVFSAPFWNPKLDLRLTSSRWAVLSQWQPRLEIFGVATAGGCCLPRVGGHQGCCRGTVADRRQLPPQRVIRPQGHSGRDWNAQVPKPSSSFTTFISEEGAPSQGASFHDRWYYPERSMNKTSPLGPVSIPVRRHRTLFLPGVHLRKYKVFIKAGKKKLFPFIL